MHWFISITIVALVIAVTAIPITPSASELQYLAEQMRSDGMAEVHASNFHPPLHSQMFASCC